MERWGGGVFTLPRYLAHVNERRIRPEQIEAVLGRHFDSVFNPDERREFLERVHAWEDQEPDLTRAEQIAGWLNIAYNVAAEHQPSRA